ncbi:thioredoxin domain-containing protein 3 homolog [Saccostrea cucullata]|uniref:thioredoxin domain-containing protein 3 homolog n=1 Tax=Saccostrea cuccullata TaxID=36930 RepID=UPI002ECFB4E1
MAAAMSAEKVYWRRKLPQGFQLFMENLARSVIRQQPEDVLEYAAMYFERKLIERNAALRRLPDVSYLQKLGYKTINKKPTTESDLPKERAAVDSITAEEENKKVESAHAFPERKSLKEQGGVRSDGAVAHRDVSSPVHLQKTAGDDVGGRDTPIGVSEAVASTLKATQEELACETSRLSATEQVEEGDEQDDAHASHEKIMLAESEERIEMKQDLLNEIRESSRSLHKTQTTQETTEDTKEKISAESIDTTEHRKSDRELAQSIEQVVHAEEVSRISIETKRPSVAVVDDTEHILPTDVHKVGETFSTDKTNESISNLGECENIVEAGPVVPVVEAGPVVPVVEAGPVVPVVEAGPAVPVAVPEPNIESQQHVEIESSKHQDLAEEQTPDVQTETEEVGDENQDEHLVESCAVTCSAEALLDEKEDENRESESEPTNIEHERETTSGQSKEAVSRQDVEEREHTKDAASGDLENTVDDSHEEHKEDIGSIEKSDQEAEVHVEETKEQTDGLTQSADEHSEEPAKQTEEMQQAEGTDQHPGETVQADEETQQAEGTEQHNGETSLAEEETQPTEGTDQHPEETAQAEEETQQAEGTDQHPEETAQAEEEIQPTEGIDIDQHPEETAQAEKETQQAEGTDQHPEETAQAEEEMQQAKGTDQEALEPAQAEEETQQEGGADQHAEESTQQTEEISEQKEDTEEPTQTEEVTQQADDTEGQETAEPGEQNNAEEKGAINHTDTSGENPPESNGTSESTLRKDTEIADGTEKTVDQNEAAQEIMSSTEKDNTESSEPVDNHEQGSAHGLGADENVKPGSPDEKQHDSKQEEITQGNTVDVPATD